MTFLYIFTDVRDFPTKMKLIMTQISSEINAGLERKNKPYLDMDLYN